MARVQIGSRQAGIVVILFALAFALIIADFTRKVESLNSVLHQTCSLPDAVCPFIGTPYQATIGYAMSGLLAAFGLFLIFLGRKDEMAGSDLQEQREALLKGMDPESQKLYEIVRSSGAVFQSELAEKTGFTKVRVTRMLDRLEAKGLVERRRRGMTNIVTIRR